MCSVGQSKASAFTLVELMITVVIIGILTAAAVQTFVQVSRVSRSTVIGNDFRQYRDAFQTYAMEYGTWPEQAPPGVVPSGLETAIRGFERSPVGGQWQWVNNDDGAAVHLVDPSVGTDVMARVDEMLDDGELTAGNFQLSGGTTYILQVDR